jgi:hypothetical protein
MQGDDFYGNVYVRKLLRCFFLPSCCQIQLFTSSTQHLLLLYINSIIIYINVIYIIYIIDINFNHRLHLHRIHHLYISCIIYTNFHLHHIHDLSIYIIYTAVLAQELAHRSYTRVLDRSCYTVVIQELASGWSTCIWSLHRFTWLSAEIARANVRWNANLPWGWTTLCGDRACRRTHVRWNASFSYGVS